VEKVANLCRLHFGPDIAGVINLGGSNGRSRAW